MFSDRMMLYKKLEEEFDGKLLVYVTSDRPNMSAQIAPDVIDYFINQLDKIGSCRKLILYLYTRGGDTSAAWNIVNLLKMYGDELEVIVPHKAHSAGTMISLGANRIIMTKQATLSPIDPSITTPLNPQAPGNGNPIPVSVEAVNGYLDYARDELKISDQKILSDIFMKLSDSVSPLVLGEVYRSRAQIKMLAKSLLVNQKLGESEIQKVVEFLCSESGSHDYTINRREARESLNLNVEKPTPAQYEVIKAVYDDINEELSLNSPFNPAEINGEFGVRRSLLESLDGGADYFITEGVIKHGKGAGGEDVFQSTIVFQGWRHDCSEPEKQALIVSTEKGENEYEACDEFQL